MPEFCNIETGDVITAEGPVADYYADTEPWVLTSHGLRGKELAEALRARSLPTTGSADEKRARLADKEMI